MKKLSARDLKKYFGIILLYQFIYMSAFCQSENSRLDRNQNIVQQSSNQPNGSGDDSSDFAQNQTSNPNLIKLGVSVNHSEVVAPVPNYLRTGSVYDENFIKSQIANSRYWFRIPNSLAGTWHRRFEQILTSTNPNAEPVGSKFLSETYFVKGKQFDKLNNIWDTKLLPEFGDINNENCLSTVRARSILYEFNSLGINPQNDNELVTVGKMRMIYINKLDNRVLVIRQAEVISTQTVVNQNMFREINSVKWFDQDGRPLYEDRRLSFMRKTQPFEVVNILPNNEDLHKDFIQYLIDHNLDNLVPN